jgi:hypothetical protein
MSDRMFPRSLEAKLRGDGSHYVIGWRLPIGYRELARVELGFDEPAESEQRAAARLFAAAPDLLAALKQAEHFLFDDSGTRIADADVVLAVRAAIAKAEGQS